MAASARCSTRPASREVTEAGPRCRWSCSACPACAECRRRGAGGRETSARRARLRCIARASSATSSSRQRPRSSRRVLADGRGEVATSTSVLIKADVQGSAEALRDALIKLSTDEVQVKVVSRAASAASPNPTCSWRRPPRRSSSASTCAPTPAPARGKENGVDLRYYSVIYEAIDDVKQALTGLLSPEIRETDRRRGPGARGVPLEQVRRRRRLPGHRRHGQAWQPDPRAARQRRDLRG
jgi:hypothetical protein